jgi:hypothetical protein
VSTRVRILVGFLILLFAAAGTAWFLRTFERVEEEVEVGYRGAARHNPYFAAERLFDRLGAPARTAAAGLDLPPPGHTLFLLREERSLADEELGEVLRWVAQGGRLVVARPEAPTLDPLLRHFGVTARRVKLPETEEPPDEAPAKTAPAQEQKDAESAAEEVEQALAGVVQEVMEIPLPGADEGSARIGVPWNVPRLAGRGRGLTGRAGSAGGDVLLLYSHGEGRVLFLADAGLLTNARIGEHQHARLAWHLATAGGEPPAGVQIVFRDDVPPLRALLVRHAWAFLVSGTLALAAWLWARAGRFGPVVPEPSPDRRRLLEHVEAAGQYLWRSGRSAELIEGARQAVLARLERRQPAWARLPQRELAKRLGVAANLPPHYVDEALRGQATSDPAELLSLIQTLEKIRRSL